MNRSPLACTIIAALLAASPVAWCGDDAESMLPNGEYRSLVGEIKAYRVGDVLTVVVLENASATTTADSRAQRSTSLTAQAGNSRTQHAIQASAGTDNDGGGRTQRSGRLAAQLSVRIANVFANGDLAVEGRQTMTVNGEEQTIALTGIVRPRDIGENNVVASTRVANAQIQFDGEGFVTDKSRPGWVSRLLTWLGF